MQTILAIVHDIDNHSPKEGVMLATTMDILAIGDSDYVTLALFAIARKLGTEPELINDGEFFKIGDKYFTTLNVDGNTSGKMLIDLIGA